MHANAHFGAREIKRYYAVIEDAEKLLEIAINKFGLSASAYLRVYKVGLTFAERAGTENIEASQIAEAIQYQTLDRRM
jgi:magnesium chelatase family protein